MEEEEVHEGEEEEVLIHHQQFVQMPVTNYQIPLGKATPPEGNDGFKQYLKRKN